MPDAAIIRTPRQVWALPGGRHDWMVRGARVVLPMLIGVLSAGLVFAPLIKSAEISFVLDKNAVAVSTERLRITAAVYRGADSDGQPFTLKAGSAVQVSSKDPVVRLKDLEASIVLPEGPATLGADAGRYDMEREIVNVDGGIRFRTADGYSLDASDVVISLKNRRVASAGPVKGQLPLGSFSAGRMTADLVNRTVVLEGGAHLHIVQGGVR